MKTKSCKFCKTEIVETASVCPQCHNFQKLPKWLPFGTPYFALLLSVLSILAILYEAFTRFTATDDSDVAVSYIDRSDVTVPLLVSNSGTRPAVIGSSGMLEMSLKLDGKLTNYFFWFSLSNSSRENLILPEGKSRQYFYVLSKEEVLVDGKTFSLQRFFDDLDAGDFISVNSCHFNLRYTDFSGADGIERLLIHERAPGSPESYADFEGTENPAELLYNQWMGAQGCIIKIPQPLRRKYGYSG